MLILREAQVRALIAPARKALEARVVAHVERHFPDACGALGDDGTREVVALGVARAGHHELETDGDTETYVALMFTFGAHFDTDPGLPWAAAALAAPSARMAGLYASALQHLAEARGLDAPAPAAD